MTDRELIGVFWATVAAIPVILAIVWTVNRGLDQQERAERREILNSLTREAHEDLEAYKSSTAAETADQPSASDSPRRGGGTSFQEQ